MLFEIILELINENLKAAPEVIVEIKRLYEE
jgi:hypothetical protein